MSTTNTQPEPLEYTILRLRDILADKQIIQNVHTTLHHSMRRECERIETHLGSQKKSIKARATRAECRGETDDTAARLAAQPAQHLSKANNRSSYAGNLTTALLGRMSLSSVKDDRTEEEATSEPREQLMEAAIVSARKVLEGRLKATRIFASATNSISALLDGKSLRGPEEDRKKAEELTGVTDELMSTVGFQHRKLLAEHLPLVISILNGDTAATYPNETWRTLIPQLYRVSQYCQDVLNNAFEVKQASASPLAGVQGAGSTESTYILDTEIAPRDKWAKVVQAHGDWEVKSKILSVPSLRMTKNARSKRMDDTERARTHFGESVGIWVTSLLRDTENDEAAMEEVRAKLTELTSWRVDTKSRTRQ